MAKGRTTRIELTTLPYARGRVSSIVVSSLSPEVARGRVTALDISSTTGAPAATGRIMQIEGSSAVAAGLPLPGISVSILRSSKGYRVTGTATATDADEWAWSLDGSVTIQDTDDTISLFWEADQSEKNRTVYVRYRRGDVWSDAASTNVLVPKWPFWIGNGEGIDPYNPIPGTDIPEPGDTARGRIGFLSASAETVIQPPLLDREDFTPAEDTPTFSFVARTAGDPPTLAGSAGWLREKRISAAETPAGGSQTSTNALDIEGSTRFRYGGVTNVPGSANYVSTTLKTGGSPQSAYRLLTLEFDTPVTNQVQIRLSAPTNNPRLGLVLVNGRRVQATPVYATATGGQGYAATLTFPTAAARRIKIYGLNHNIGSFGGVAVASGTVTKPATPIQRRIVILGDSLTNGSSGVTPVDTFCWDVARRMGADDIVQMGIGGTGFVNDGGSPQGSNPDGVYINRVPDILALNPDVLLIVGGRNDSTAPSLASRVAELMAATSSIPERWVISDSIISASNTIIRNGAQAAGAGFVDMSDYQTLVPLSDGIHPTWEGHRQFAQIVITRMGLTTPADPGTLTPATGNPSTGLFFELPTSTQIATGANPERKILAHYYAPQPGAFANSATDYYETGYLPVNGEGGIHAAYGGLLRDRPMLGAPFSTSPSWQRNMQGKEIQAAMQAGVDGFFCNIMGSSGDNYNRYVWMAEEASANYPGFLVVPMIDGTTSMALNESVDVAANRMNQFLSMSCAWRLADGRYVISVFKMEGVENRTTAPVGPAYWSALKTAMQNTYGKTVVIVGAYNNINKAVDYSGVQYAAGQWGPGADPGIYNNLTNYGTAIKARGEKFLFGLWAQDVRPRSDLFDEARNSEALRAGLDAAMRQNADIIQFCTWSDHSEGSMVRPTVKQGSAKLDVAAYRIVKWKTGKYPRILRDAIYLSYRNQMAASTITGGQTRFMSQWARTNRSTFREAVEVLTYFTAPAVVTLKVGNNDYTYTAPAGEYAYTVTAQPGEVSVKAVRSSVEIARINAPVVIKASTVNQDREYCWFSSIRGTTGQYDPTPGSPTPNPANYLP